jgi:hypothetical protein
VYAGWLTAPAINQKEILNGRPAQPTEDFSGCGPGRPFLFGSNQARRTGAANADLLILMFGDEAMNGLKPVDHSALRTNQAVIIALLVMAFILNSAPLAGVVAFFMLLGSLALRRPGFFWVYTRILRPLGVIRPDAIEDHAEPHVFAQGFGGVVVLAGFVSLLAGAGALGWGFAWVVIALAALNLFGGFCVGCFVYYWLNRLKVPGFAKSAPQGTLPGMRPRTSGSQGARHAGQ